MSQSVDSVEIQEGIISASLNSSMLLNFLMGIYTVVYGGTFYLYLFKRAMNPNMGRYVILSAISVLYLLYLSSFILQWYFLNDALVIEGISRSYTFASTIDSGSRWIMAPTAYIYCASFIVSDCLLTWRCYHVWGQSIRVITTPLALLLAEVGLLVAVIVMSASFNILAASQNGAVKLFNTTSSALVIVSLANTLIITFLIGYKIKSASRLDGQLSKGLFNRVVVLVTESAAVYSLGLIAYTIFMVNPSFYQTLCPALQVGYYLKAVLVISGLAPTVMVARIALTSSSNTFKPTVTQLTGLQFESVIDSGNCTNSIGEGIEDSLNTNLEMDTIPFMGAKAS